MARMVEEAYASTAVLEPPAVELTDEQADWLIQRIEWSMGLNMGLAGLFYEAFGVGVELGVRGEFREEARAAVRRIARPATKGGEL